MEETSMIRQQFPDRQLIPEIIYKSPTRLSPQSEKEKPPLVQREKVNLPELNVKRVAQGCRATNPCCLPSASGRQHFL
jgi:hypothetical protein